MGVSGAVVRRVHSTYQQRCREESSQQFPRITIEWRSLGLLNIVNVVCHFALLIRVSFVGKVIIQGTTVTPIDFACDMTLLQSPSSERPDNLVSVCFILAIS